MLENQSREAVFLLFSFSLVNQVGNDTDLGVNIIYFLIFTYMASSFPSLGERTDLRVVDRVNATVYVLAAVNAE